MSVRLHHIAELCKCSQATVSRALRNHPAISDPMRAKIHVVAVQMGYRRHSARILRQMNTVAVVQSAFAGISLELPELLRQPEKDEASFVFLTHDGAPEREESLAVAARQFASAVIVLTANEKLLAKLAKPPSFVLKSPSPQETVVTLGVRLDDRAGTREATDYLAHLGHKAIAFVSSPTSLPDMRERLAGFREAMKEHALDAPPDFVVEDGVSRERSVDALRKLLAGESRPTAIMAATDALALDALATAAEADLRVPEDLSIIGFGNRPCSAERSPGLTTVEYPVKETTAMLTVVAQTLLAGEAAVLPPLAVLKPRLVIRGSCTYREGR